LKGFSFIPSQQTTRAVVAAPRRLRFLLITAIFAGWAFLILVRLLWLQVITHSQFVELAARQQQRTFEVAPRRGVLYDRNMHELAMTVLVDSVYGVPTEIRDKDATAASLSRVVHTDPTDGFTTQHQIDARFHASKNFAWVARKLDPAKVDAAARGRVFSGADAKQAGLIDELGGLQLALQIAKAKAGIDEGHPIRVRRFPPENDRWQKLADRVMRLAGLDSRAPSLRAPREIREALAHFGIAERPGNVRLPPLPPLWH